MTKKCILSALLAIVWLSLISLFYKTIVVMLLLALWQKYLKQRFAVVGKYHVVRCMWVVLAISLWVGMPRYRVNSSDRVRLVYLDDEGNAKHPPLSQYVLSTLMPESEIVNFAINNLRLTTTFARFFGIGVGSRMIHQAQEDCKNGKIGNFTKPYRLLGLDNPISGVYPQVFNATFGTNYRTVNIITPKHMNDDKAYPLVVFCHGYLGNWQLYQGIWKELDNCIVLSIGTRGLDGIFSQSDIDKIFTYYIPALRKMGYNIDEQRLHLMGLSNGGSAIYAAMHSYHAKDFKSITTISCNLVGLRKVPCQVNLIGGGKDVSACRMPEQHKKLKKMGVKSELFYDEEENHFVLVNRREEIISFIKKSLYL